jgi:hypothetical protein
VIPMMMMSAEPTLRLVPPIDPTSPRAPQAARPEVPAEAPPLDWAGRMVVRQHWIQPVGAIGVCAFVASTAAGAMAAGGGATVQGLAWACLSLIPSCVLGARFERRVLGNRRYHWYGHAVPPAGARRRTDAERLQAMAETATAAGGTHRG